MKVFDAWRTWTDAEPPLRDRLPAEVVNRLAQAYQAAADWRGDQVRDRTSKRGTTRKPCAGSCR
jgi:guanosine-3',5'-bis(diphosphate) 3'-pyrophosphohydrolase